MAKQVKTVTEPNYHRTAKAAADILKNLILKYDGTTEGQVAAATAASDAFAGVSVEKMFSGKSQSYQFEGITQVLSGAAVSVHALVTANASSKAVAAATGNIVLGRALTAAAGADEIIEVELWKGRSLAP